MFEICKRHNAQGAKALRDAPSGRKSGKGRLLDAAQEALVRKLVASKAPGEWITPSRSEPGWAELADALEVLCLPSYSPQLNPDEMTNADINKPAVRR